MPNETVHISLGPTANHISSHLVNLQGLAATRSGHDDERESLCDPDVTHDVSPVDDSIYASSRQQPPYVYVPRMLVVDGSHSFGDVWDASCSNGGDRRRAAASEAVACWKGPVSIWNSPRDEAALFGGEQQQQQQQQRDGGASHCDDEQRPLDPLDAFRHAACTLGLSTAHSRYVASAPGMNFRRVSWNDDQREQQDDDDDDDDDAYGYGQERVQEEKRRRLERIEFHNEQVRKGLHESMADAWEQTFYSKSYSSDDRLTQTSRGEIGPDSTLIQQHPLDARSSHNQGTHGATTTTFTREREIHWHDYLMPPRPPPSKYQIPLPFDTEFVDCNSFFMGYRPACGVTSDNDKNCGFAGVNQSWRENVLSESLRKVLEGSDEVKGFNLFVDGGQCHTPTSTFPLNRKSAHSKQLPNIIPGGGLYAGLAASILEELHDECRSAGRWTVLVDPQTCHSFGKTPDDHIPQFNQVQQFRRQLNAGMALHGLSTNSDTFLPLSLEGAHRALCGERAASQNRVLFEGSAAIALALEASTLFYRLRRNPLRIDSSVDCARSRLGIQSGFYQGFSGNSGYGAHNNSDTFASAPCLTYHEFLACTRSSSDRRRSVLELDAMLCPLSYPSIDNASALGHGSGFPSNILASLLTTTATGIGSQYLGQLHQRMMKGTSLEQMQMEQDRNFRSRTGTSARNSGPGEWLEDSCTGHVGGGGLLNSLSGHSSPFGRRSDHHHFALSTALRPASSESNTFAATSCCTSAFIRPVMESMGAKYRPEVSVGVVVKDTVVDLTGVGSYWNSIFRRAQHPATPRQNTTHSSREVAHNTSILSVLGNSTRSYPRLRAISTGFIDSLHSRNNMGYLTRDAMAGIMPEKDDCEEALEYCRELVDVYEPPLGSGLVDGEDENDLDDAYFDEH
ncbi:hypothetical protein ACHAW6_015982 [Cyclotella cf. meneghiniana]